MGPWEQVCPRRSPNARAIRPCRCRARHHDSSCHYHELNLLPLSTVYQVISDYHPGATAFPVMPSGSHLPLIYAGSQSASICSCAFSTFEEVTRLPGKLSCCRPVPPDVPAPSRRRGNKPAFRGHPCTLRGIQRSCRIISRQRFDSGG